MDFRQQLVCFFVSYLAGVLLLGWSPSNEPLSKYQSEEFISAVDDAFRNYNTPEEPGVKIVVLVRRNSLDAFMNQMISLSVFRNISISVICEEPSDSFFLHKVGFPVVHDIIGSRGMVEYVNSSKCSKSKSPESIYKSTRLASLTYSKIIYYKKLMAWRTPFFLADSNVVWKKSPWMIMGRMSKKQSFMFGIHRTDDINPDFSRPISFGFMRTILPMRKAIFPEFYARSLGYICDEKESQYIFSHLFKNLGIKWAIDSNKEVLIGRNTSIIISSFPFTSYATYCDKSSYRSPAVIHPICAESPEAVRQKLFDMGEWHLADDWKSRPIISDRKAYIRSIDVRVNS